ncbi:hypothetical protein F2Q70_00042993 [Brassica cretica]|uniref:Uncharacterized protein n=1 Tax=Brassica cretica TaxID=69181 RepID=A0A8S9KLB1_BRACR|nr:hypothetical protein F2Q70_00042993 [Brassica cretica]
MPELEVIFNASRRARASAVNAEPTNPLAAAPFISKRVLCLGLLMTLGLVALFTGAVVVVVAFLFAVGFFATGFLLEEACCFWAGLTSTGGPIRREVYEPFDLLHVAHPTKRWRARREFESPPERCGSCCGLSSLSNADLRSKEWLVTSPRSGIPGGNVLDDLFYLQHRSVDDGSYGTCLYLLLKLDYPDLENLRILLGWRRLVVGHDVFYAPPGSSEYSVG